MNVLGLIGGIGSGKSTVASLFEKLGAVVIDADKVGHEVLLDSEIKKAVAERWGKELFRADGEIDRRKLASVVFDVSEQGRKDLDYLISLTHPLIGKKIEGRLRELEVQGVETVVFDAPLLLEAHWDGMVQKLVFVDVPQPLRLQRVLARGWTSEEFEAREAAQFSVDFKRDRADWIVNNAENLEKTLDQVRKIWQNFSVPPKF